VSIVNAPLDLLIIQPTPFCNLDCDYCYLPNRSSKALMSQVVLSKAIERVFESGLIGDDFTVVWHAGEPLAVPHQWYEFAVRLIAERNSTGHKVTHNVQTNGTLINDGWCDLFRQHDFRVGLSIDGPAFIHDLHRKRRSGHGSHDRVMKGVALLQKHGISFHIICVVTSDSLGHADEIFDFFKNLGPTNVGFNIEEAEGINRQSSMTGEAECEALRVFVRRLFELWLKNDKVPPIREFTRVLSAIDTWKPGLHSWGQETTPFRILNIDVHGNFSTFSPELLGHETSYGPFVFGNVMSDSIESCIRSKRYRAVQKDILRGVRRCKTSCEYFCLCGGGSPSNKYVEHGTFDCTETRHCINTTQVFIDEMFGVLESNLGLAKS
jgi:uncharacterized protein